MEGHQAVQEYEALGNQDVVIVEESRSGAGFQCSGARLPDLTALQLDAYVFPESLQWTMAFTHESGVHGPFFTRRDWCRIDD